MSAGIPVVDLPHSIYEFGTPAAKIPRSSTIGTDDDEITKWAMIGKQTEVQQLTGSV